MGSAAKALEVEPMRKSVSGVVSRPAATSALPKPVWPFGTLAVHDRDGHARSMRVLEDFLGLLLKLLDGLRGLRRVVFLIPGQADGREQEEKERGNKRSYDWDSPHPGSRSACMKIVIKILAKQFPDRITESSRENLNVNCGLVARLQTNYHTGTHCSSPLNARSETFKSFSSFSSPLDSTADDGPP